MVTGGVDEVRCQLSPSFDAVITRMKLHSEKCMELSQTIVSLSGSIGMEGDKGCKPSSQIEIKGGET